MVDGAYIYKSISLLLSHTDIIICFIIGFSTIYFSILVNHSVRLKRIKLIYGFSQTFNPDGKKRDEKKGKGRIETDIRYSPSLEFVVTKYITDLDEAVSEEDFVKLKDIVKTENQQIEQIINKINCFSMPVNRKMLYYSTPLIVTITTCLVISLPTINVISSRFHINTEVSGDSKCLSDYIPFSIVFISSYIASITMLVRAVSLFDLSSVTFYRILLHIFGSFFFWVHYVVCF